MHTTLTMITVAGVGLAVVGVMFIMWSGFGEKTKSNRRMDWGFYLAVFGLLLAFVMDLPLKYVEQHNIEQRYGVEISDFPSTKLDSLTINDEARLCLVRDKYPNQRLYCKADSKLKELRPVDG